MISFEPLWKTMKNRGVSQYKLIKEYHFSTGQLDRLRKNGNVSTYTLDQLCQILDCRLEDIAQRGSGRKRDKITQFLLQFSHFDGNSAAPGRTFSPDVVY